MLFFKNRSPAKCILQRYLRRTLVLLQLLQLKKGLHDKLQCKPNRFSDKYTTKNVQKKPSLLVMALIRM